MYEYAIAFSGLGLFLSGLHLLSASIKPLAGKSMRIALSRLTESYFSRALAGSLLGAITQSTSGATFVCMGLVNSGTLKFKNSLNILAWSSVGGSILVFLVAIDIRLAGLVLVGIVGISHLFNADRIEKIKYLVAIFFALGILFLGLGMIKESTHIFRDSYWVKEFIEFAAESTAICFIIGLLFTLITQSSSTVAIVAITLVSAGVISFFSAITIVFGANVGSGVSLFLITSHLSGLQKQISFFQLLTKLGGVLCLAPLFLIFAYSHYSQFLPQNPANIAYQISVIYLSLQISGAIFVSTFQSKIISSLNRLFPESEEESLSKPKFIYPEALEDTSIALSLIKKEQDRLISTLSCYLDPLRTIEIETLPLENRHDANMHLAREIKHFIDEISHQDLGDEMNYFLELQSRLESIISLMGSLNAFTAAVSTTKNHQEGLSGSIVEGLHLVLELMGDSLSNLEDFDILMELTSDRGHLMDKIRDTLISDNSKNLAERKSLFVSTRIFERILWQIRQMLLSNLRLE